MARFGLGRTTMSVATELRVLPLIDLHFPIGLPGFKGAHSFRLESLGEAFNPNPFGRLVAKEPILLQDGSRTENVRLIVAAPGLLWPDYVVEVDDGTEALLQLDDASQAAALVIVTLGETISNSTANLFAPIVLNTEKQLATQLVPDWPEAASQWSIRTPLPVAN